MMWAPFNEAEREVSHFKALKSYNTTSVLLSSGAVSKELSLKKFFQFLKLSSTLMLNPNLTLQRFF